MTERIDDVLRHAAPHVLASLVRRYQAFDECEDAVQEALLAATSQWPVDGVPDDPRAWLVTVARRRVTDELRRRGARRRREETVAARSAPLERPVLSGTDPSDTGASETDDSLQLLLLCCHPSLSATSQVALTLRAVGGLTTAEIAAAFLVPEPTMAQRISRAKQTVREHGLRLELPPPAELAGRLRSVLHVLYLVFNEGYTATAGPDLARDDMTAEAIRLTRALHGALPTDGEVMGLLALMVLTEARRAARVGTGGVLVPLTEQDRRRWDRDLIAEGTALVERALRDTHPVGPYQVQAAIAVVHDDAKSSEATDWSQVLGLYDVLERLAPNPMVTLNRAVALAMVAGPAAGLAVVDELEAAPGRIAEHHRLVAVRAHLLELAGDRTGAHAGYRRAAALATSRPEQRHLRLRAERLTS